MLRSVRLVGFWVVVWSSFLGCSKATSESPDGSAADGGSTSDARSTGDAATTVDAGLRNDATSMTDAGSADAAAGDAEITDARIQVCTSTVPVMRNTMIIDSPRSGTVVSTNQVASPSPAIVALSDAAAAVNAAQIPFKAKAP